MDSTKSALMDITSIDTSTTAHSSPSACPFLHILNLDVRTIIYQYLLVGSYNKRELDMKSREYDRNRKQILQGQDKSYKFHLSILGTNRQIREEAIDIFQRMNTFVSLTHDRIVENRLWGIGLQNLKIAILARGERAHEFPGISMSIDFDLDYQIGALWNNNQNSRASSVFLIEDLPAACASLQCKADRIGARKASIRISINSHTGAVSTLLENGYPMPDSKLSRCLTPLGRIRGVKHVEIHGPVSSPYKSAMIASMCDRPLDVTETMELIGTQSDQGDEASIETHWELAISAYKTALHTIDGCSFRLDRNEDVVLINGRFQNQQASRARADAKVQLHTYISDVYFRSRKLRLARAWVERFYGPLHSSDDRGNTYKFPLQISPISGATPAVYAELLVMAARISVAHGHDHEAIYELTEARQLDPANLHVDRMLDECHERCSMRSQRFILQQERRKNHAQRKLDQAIQIIESRKAKGDEAFRNMDFILAKTKYEAAFDKVLHTQCADYLSHSKHYSVPDLKFPDELRLEILSSLVSLSLEINEYDDVHRWADMIIASEPDHLYYCQRPGFDAEVWRAGKACYTAYYGKAFASLKQGNPILAIENFINASLCNSRCDATYYLLENLKRAEDWKESPEASEKRRLYLEWDSTELKEYST